MITLQDMPDDILEMIYKHLDIYDSARTNLAINKRINVSRITSIYDRRKTGKIPRSQYKYLIIDYKLFIDELQSDNFIDLYGLKCNDLIDGPKYVDLKFLYLMKGINTDFSYLTNLLILFCPFCKITNIDPLINLKTLVCDHSDMTNVNKLTKLTYLSCIKTNISDVSKLVNLEYLVCDDSKIDDVSMLTNLIELSCVRTCIKDVNRLKKLRSLNCYSTFDITDISAQ